jgi:hypothetical protein
MAPKDGWRNSAARRLLIDMIVDEEIHDDIEESEMYLICQQHEEFNDYPYDANDWKTKVKGAFNEVTEGKKRAAREKKFLLHDRHMFPKKAEPDRWADGSADKLMRQHYQEGKFKQDKPNAIWEQYPEYQKYEEEVFRNHIYQEGYRLKFNQYLNDKREEKEEKAKEMAEAARKRAEAKKKREEKMIKDAIEKAEKEKARKENAAASKKK